MSSLPNLSLNELSTFDFASFLSTWFLTFRWIPSRLTPIIFEAVEHKVHINALTCLIRQLLISRRVWRFAHNFPEFQPLEILKLCVPF